jgi:hypothetical protein
MSSEPSSAKMRMSATIFPLGVRAAAYWPSPGTSPDTSFVTIPVTSSAAFSPEIRIRVRSLRSKKRAPLFSAEYSLISDITFN